MTTILSSTHEAYDALVLETVDIIINLGINKGGEYAGDKNRLENFVRNAINLRVEPELIWAVYAGKHWDAIQQYILDIGEGKTRFRSESIEGRADDLIVYLLLFKAMVRARQSEDFTYRLARDEKNSTQYEGENSGINNLGSDPNVDPEEIITNGGHPAIPAFLTAHDPAPTEETLMDKTMSHVDAAIEGVDALIDAVAKTRTRK